MASPADMAMALNLELLKRRQQEMQRLQNLQSSQQQQQQHPMGNGHVLEQNSCWSFPVFGSQSLGTIGGGGGDGMNPFCSTQPVQSYPFTNEPTPYNSHTVTSNIEGHMDQHPRSFFMPSSDGAIMTDTRGTTSTATPAVSANPGETTREEPTETPYLPSDGPPPSNPSTKETDAWLARDLNKLSLKERNQLYEEIHGVADTTTTTKDGLPISGVMTTTTNPTDFGHYETDDDVDDEDPFETMQMVENVIDEIQTIPQSRKTAYLYALQQNEGYVHDHDFILRCLRATQYNVRDAAYRVVGYLEYKLELFGRHKLAKDIDVHDFYGPNAADPQNDWAALQSGLFQILPSLDRGGRTVIAKYHCWDFEHFPLLSKLRVFYYLLLRATDTAEQQRRGIVIVVFNMIDVSNREETWRNTTLLWNFPAKVCAFHVCHKGSQNVRGLTSLAMAAINAMIRMRFRIHEGSLMEVLYGLRSFGITNNQLIDGGTVNDTQHKLWIEREKQLLKDGSGSSRPMSVSDESETHPTSSSPVTANTATQVSSYWCATPTENDVLFGRGKNSMSHPGNIKLRQTIESMVVEYEAARPLGKTVISSRVVSTIQASGGRFLKQCDEGRRGGWVEVDADTSREKISHLFRDRRRKSRQHQSKKVHTSAASSSASVSASSGAKT